MWTVVKKLKYFADSFIAFTAFPLRVASCMGLIVSLMSFGWCAVVMIMQLVWGQPVQGWSSLMAVLSFLGGIQLLTLGVIGEYLWRTLEESRRRPLFIVDSVYPPQT